MTSYTSHIVLNGDADNGKLVHIMPKHPKPLLEDIADFDKDLPIGKVMPELTLLCAGMNCVENMGELVSVTQPSCQVVRVAVVQHRSLLSMRAHSCPLVVRRPLCTSSTAGPLCGKAFRHKTHEAAQRLE
jgi:hypothetical protein